MAPRRALPAFAVALCVTATTSLMLLLRPQEPPAAPPGPPLPSLEVPRLTLDPSAIEMGTGTAKPFALSRLPWARASTGWQVLADFDTPLRDSSFLWGPMLVAGHRFESGIATYPFSEIVYEVGGKGLRFTARLGITDDSKDGAGSVRFFIYGDEFLLFESGIVRAGEEARSCDLPIQGIDTLTLIVDDAGDGSKGDYALWGEPQLLLGDEVAPAALARIESARREVQAAQTPRLEAERSTLASTGLLLGETLRRRAPASPEARAGFDQASSTVALGNDALGVVLGYGGDRNGRLWVLRRQTHTLVLADVVPSVTTKSGQDIRLTDLSADAREPPVTRRIDDPYDGAGVEAIAYFRSSNPVGRVKVSLIAFDAGPRLRIRLSTEGIPVRAVRYVDPQGGGVILGEEARYATDRSHLYLGQARPDGHWRRAPFEATKPALLWSDSRQEGLLLWTPDHVPSPAWLSLQGSPGSTHWRLGVELQALLGDFGPGEDSPPPLDLEVVDGPLGQPTFARYRRSMAARFPAPPWPESARYQWGSWYAFGPGITAGALLRQIALLHEGFGDLGRWQFLIDAGWFVQYGREDAEPSAVDFAKFPQGVAAVSRAAHVRAMEVLLYLGTGFIHDSAADGGEWLALRGLIERHPDWMIRFQSESAGVNRFLLDYNNPEVRRYVADLVADFFNVHGADGILLDGMADAEGQLIPRIERDGPNGPRHPLLPAMTIYRLIREEADRHRPGAFITNGWLDPMAANPYAHAFYYGDESDVPDSPYPFAGFFPKLDYALFSRLALGQRAYVGSSRGDPRLPEARWWAQAGAALGAPAGVSIDLADLDSTTLAVFRADLAGLYPYQGETRFGPGLLPETFATTRDGVTYLGVVNRQHKARDIQVPLDPLGLERDTSYTAFDVAAGSGRSVQAELVASLPPRSFRLFVLRAAPGLLWSSSVAQTQSDALGMVITLTGPSQAGGFANVAAPPPTSVLLDGVPLRLAGSALADREYAYSNGVLSLRYQHTPSPRRLQISWSR